METREKNAELNSTTTTFKTLKLTESRTLN